MRYQPYAWMGLFLAVLAGCESNDPRQGGFFGGIAGLASDKYDARVREREARLAVVRGQGQELTAESTQLETANAALADKISVQERRLGELQRDIAALESDTKKLRLQKASQEQERAELAAKIASVKSEIEVLRKRTATASSAAEVEQLKRRLQELEQEALQLHEVYQGLL